MTDDVAEFLAVAGDFLASRPVEHNLALTIADLNRDASKPCRWAWVTDGDDVVGALIQAPSTYTATVTPMPDAAVRSLVEHLSDIVPDMPGMNGEAHTVATFAGTWASKLQIPAQPVAAQRLYRLGTLRLPEDVPGRLRRAGSYDVPRLITWDEAFVTETGVSRPPSGDRAALITQRVTEGMFWLWEVADEPVSMAFASPPLAGASRIGAVYTPPARRGNGYANASVGAISAHLLASGVDCLLYTQLVNPISSRIYQRLGYEPTAEILVYRFGPA